LAATPQRHGVRAVGRRDGDRVVGRIAGGEGLFGRAISQSGAWMAFAPSPGMTTREQAEKVGLKAATDAGVTTAAQLRAMSTAT